MSGGLNLNAYLDRIGHTGSIAPNVATLEALHLAHPTAIPFETLDVLMGLPIKLDLPSLNGKLVLDKRGGYCFEHNLLFLAVLQDLEYSAKGHLARVVWNQAEGPETRRTHMFISVEIGGATYLCDVGFGGQTLTAPLKLRSGVEQDTPHGLFRISGEDPNYQLEAQIGEEWRALYAFDLMPANIADIEAGNLFTSSDPQSLFLTHLVAARVEKGKRHTLHNTQLTTHTIGGETEKTLLSTLPELKQALSTVFAIQLPSAEKLDPALEKILGETESGMP
jgi:N-hydroxyarylamine O-acetyltransferase